MQNEPLVLSFDFGTQSVRAILFNQKGDTINKVKIEFVPYFSLNSGWAEQQPETYWDNFCAASKKLKELEPERWNDIKAVVVTTIRDTCVCVDESGKVLRPIIVWLDQREIKSIGNRIPSSKKAILKMVNMYDSAVVQSRVSACNWIHDNEPEVFSKIYKFLMLSGFITFKLTDKMVDSSSAQCGHIPFDYKKKEWQSDNALTSCLFDVKRKHMPDLMSSGDTLGYITEAASKETGIPQGLSLIATGSDKGCETLGAGVVDNSGASLSFGTTATVQFSTDKYIEPQPFAPAYPAVIKSKFNPEIEIYRGYWMLTWFKKEFAEKESKQALKLGVSAEELLNKRLREISPGCEGLILQPYWSPGLKTPTARGAILGFSDVHTRVHIYRAIIEGIGFGLYDGLKNLEKRTGNKIERLMVSGGGSQSDEICQITADLFGIPVQKVQTYETSALGAAITAFASIGVYTSLENAVRGMVRVSKEYLPDMKTHEIYEDIYQNVYRKIYPSNRKLYDEIAKILSKNYSK
ncbi:MAG TPA: FGGY-family carbohydrate kinase [Clostridia bacterium]|nr:FGGY-family carbohydrate kinase [Clostridia bacterium]